MEEEWRNIPGYEGKYQVSNVGRVRSYVGADRRGGEPRLMNIYFDIDGYPKVSLCMNKTQKGIKVGRLVLMAFVGNPPPGTEMFHIDGDRNNSRLDNLRWESHAENNRHRKSWRKPKPAPARVPMEEVPKERMSNWAFAMNSTDFEIIRSTKERHGFENYSQAVRYIIREYGKAQA